MKITFSEKVKSLTPKEFEKFFKRTNPELAKDWKKYAPMKVEEDAPKQDKKG